MKLNKLFKWCLVVLIVISAALIVWGFSAGFTTNDGQATDVLIYWAYVMVALGLLSWVVLGGIMSVKANPKSLIKGGIVLAGLAVIVLVAYFLAPAHPAFGREGQDVVSTLKLTDTMLNLTYFAGAAAIVAIIAGEIRLAINNRK
mgnify:FL=1